MLAADGAARRGGHARRPRTLDAGRALLPGALARAAREWTRHGARAHLPGPAGQRSCAAATRSAPATPTGCATTPSSTSGASPCRLAAAALDPVAGDRALLDLSLAGYVAAVLAIFGPAAPAFRLPIAAAVTLATIFLPALTDHSSYPADRQLGAGPRDRGAGVRAPRAERGPRWLIPWAVSIFVLSMTRDSTWIPIAAAAWLTLTLRSRIAWQLLGTGARRGRSPWPSLSRCRCATCMAMMLNDFQPVRDPSWGFIRSATRAPSWTCSRPTAASCATGPGTPRHTWSAGLVLLFLLGRGGRPPPSSPPQGGRRGGGAVGARDPHLQRLQARARLRADGRLRPRPGGRAAGRACRRRSRGCRMPAPLPGRSRT